MSTRPVDDTKAPQDGAASTAPPGAGPSPGAGDTTPQNSDRRRGTFFRVRFSS